MKLKLNYMPLILLIVISIIGRPTYAGEDSTHADSSLSGIAIDAIHIDLTTALLVNDLSIITDLEFTRNSILSVGLQPSYSDFMSMDLYGYSSESAKDISLLTYFSLGHNFPITLKATIGFSYRMWRKHENYEMGGDSYTYGKTIGVKYGIAAIINISRYFKIHAKISNIHNVGPSANGIGISVGWSR